MEDSTFNLTDISLACDIVAITAFLKWFLDKGNVCYCSFFTCLLCYPFAEFHGDSAHLTNYTSVSYCHLFWISQVSHVFFSPFSDDQTDANTLPAPEAKSVPAVDPRPPSPKEKCPEVLAISGKKYIIVHTEEGTKVLPVPESVESPLKVIVTAVHSGLKKPDVPVIAISAPPPPPLTCLLLQLKA